MSLLDAAALLLALAAALGLFNHHVLKLPFAIGLLISSLLASLGDDPGQLLEQRLGHGSLKGCDPQ